MAPQETRPLGRVVAGFAASAALAAATTLMGAGVGAPVPAVPRTGDVALVRSQDPPSTSAPPPAGRRPPCRDVREDNPRPPCRWWW